VIRPAPWPHLVRRFFVTLLARVDPVNLPMLDRVLSPDERRLFLTMKASDQQHSMALCERLRRDGHEEPDLLCAALLHDVGKASGRLPILYRVVYTLAAMLDPRLAHWLGRPNPTAWRRPFYLAAHHPEIGAAAAARAGSNSRVVRLIAGHNGPGSDPLSRALYTYDRRM
jgi:hypothetical protein